MRHVSHIDLVEKKSGVVSKHLTFGLEKKSGVVSKHLTFGLRNGESERRKADRYKAAAHKIKLKQQPEFTLCWLSWE